MPDRTRVVLDIFDTTGRRIARLVDAVEVPGWHETRWEGRNEAGNMVASGVYFYRLTAGKKNITKKMVFLR